MIWHASWHAVLYEHMASRSCCFLLRNSNGNVSSHSIEDTPPKTPQGCWARSVDAISQSSGWGNELLMWCHASSHRNWKFISPRRGGHRTRSSPWSCCVRVQSQAFYWQVWDFWVDLHHSNSLVLCFHVSTYVLTDRRIYKGLPLHFTAAKTDRVYDLSDCSDELFKPSSISRIPLLKQFILHY